MFPYIVYAPTYQKTVGGWRALHRLSYELNKAGYESYVTTYDCNPKWVSPYLIGDNIAKKVREGAIVIYPEIVHGNPYNARTCVRWMLNKAGALGGPLTYPKDDLVWGYCRPFMPDDWPDDRYLFLNHVDSSDFNCTNKTRSGICYCVGKGFNTPRIKETQYATEITRDWPKDDKTLENIFNTHELFVSYDNATALTDIARLCGCPVVWIPGHLEKDVAFKTEMLPENGIGWGMKEADKAKTTLDVSSLRYRFDLIYKVFQTDLIRFAEETQRVAKERTLS